MRHAVRVEVVADKSGRRIIGGGHGRIRSMSGAGNGVGGGRRRDFRRRGHCRVGGRDRTCWVQRGGKRRRGQLAQSEWDSAHMGQTRRTRKCGQRRGEVEKIGDGNCRGTDRGGEGFQNPRGGKRRRGRLAQNEWDSTHMGQTRRTRKCGQRSPQISDLLQSLALMPSSHPFSLLNPSHWV